MTDTKMVSTDWTWFADYGAASIDWTANCPATRRCEVGMGVKIGHDPKGEHKAFSGHVEFTTIGIGAIHIRALDGRPCLVRLDQGKVGVIPIIDKPAPLD